MRSHFNVKKWHLLADHHALNQLAHYRRLCDEDHTDLFSTAIKHVRVPESWN